MTIKLENLLKTQDIYLHINKFTDIRSIRNLSVSSKFNYNIYKQNQRYIDKQNIENIFSYFNLSCDIFIKSLNKLSNEELYIINIQLNKLYNHFNRNRYTSLPDFLSYIVERKLDESDILFETFIYACTFKYNIMKNVQTVFNFSNIQEFFSNSYISRFILTSSDCQYLLKHSNLKYFDIILKSITLPAGLLSFIVKDILYNESILQNVEKKIMKIIDYFLYHYCSFDFSENTSMYFNGIINELIEKNKLSLFMYVFKNKQKYGFSLNYQSLINKCLDKQNLKILKLLIIELKEDNKILENKVQISIFPESILKICENGEFVFLHYIVTKMLGQLINLQKYIVSLCDGITTYYINTKNKNNFDLDKIKWIYEYLSDENKHLLHSHVSFINIKNEY